MNYRGYFSGLDCQKYEVRIIPSGETGNEYEDILLAASEPFVVRYNESRTPFDPVRTSTASIKIVNDEYLYDALSHCAQGTKVELINTTNTASTFTEWVGYMTPKVYNAGYDSCWETFDLEAADCISSLQYIDYTEISGGGVTNLQNIINQICDACGELDGYYWTISKKLDSATTLVPSMMSISEHNFQTNDTEEYWHLNEVLEEICRYLGFTCLQWRNYMYFVDYQFLEPNDRLQAYKYKKSSGYNLDSTGGATKDLDELYVVTTESYRSGGASISLEPIYNKVVVNCNMYAVEDFIPNPFDDEFITNRIDSGNTYASIEIPPETPDKASYPNGGNWVGTQVYKDEDSGDSRYVYHQRIFDHKYWESVYSYSGSSEYTTPSAAIQKSSAITKFYRGGTLVDLGVVQKDYYSETNQKIVPSKMDFTRYICICEKHTNDWDTSSHRSEDKGDGMVVYRLKNGYRSKARLDDKCFLVLNCSLIVERHPNRNYINPSWSDAQTKSSWAAWGMWVDGNPKPAFRLHIGNKGYGLWYGGWLPIGDSRDIIEPEVRWDERKKTYWNHDIEILNNVSWEDKVNCEGIKIPLSGVDTTQPIEFEILNPDPSYWGYEKNWQRHFYETNAYMWIKDLKLSVAREGESDLGNDSDVVYENEINACSINELDEIRLRITTFTDKVQPSYSHMLLGSGFLGTILEESLGEQQAQKAEENIITKYVHQYQTPTKKFTLPLTINISPLQKLKGVDVDMPTDGYVQLGTELDYRMAMQTIIAVEKTKGNE